jgi:hypothetical protein
MPTVKNRPRNLAMSYEQDFYAWANANAGLLREGRLSEIDTENIAEELQTMGRTEKRELASRLSVLLAHLLKWQCQPERRSESWKNAIEARREDILELLEESPSLRPAILGRFDRGYLRARRAAATETGMSRDRFPENSPFTFEQALNESFWPE